MLPFVFVAHAVVDSHLHVWDGTAAGLDAGPMKIGYSAQATASVELFMDYMDEAGVDRAVFVQPWFYHWDNRYMVSCLRRFPDRFRGVCVIDPRGAEGSGGPPALAGRGRDRHPPAPASSGRAARPRPAGSGPTRPSRCGRRWRRLAPSPACSTGARTSSGCRRSWPASRLSGSWSTTSTTRFPRKGSSSRRSGPCSTSPVTRRCTSSCRASTTGAPSGTRTGTACRSPRRRCAPSARSGACGARTFPHVLAGCGYVRSRHLLPRSATFLSKEELDLVMGGTAERLWFG